MAEAVFFNALAVWATNGTKAGTVELPVTPDAGYSILSIAEANTENLFPIGKKLLFTDTEFDPQTGGYSYQIWTTNGTAAGTSKITIASPLDRTLIGLAGTKALIYSTSVTQSGVAPTVTFVLTNGTAGGTSTFRVAAPPLPYGFETYSSFYSLGSRVVFAATGKDGKITLWSSNGTAGGTGPLKVANVSPTEGLDPYDIVTVGAKAYFVGHGKNSQEGLWVTNGTAAGTTQIAVKNASTLGLDPSGLVAAGGKLFFSGFDNTNHIALWVTNGTAAGTHEVTVAGAGGKGLDPSPAGITAFGNKVIFAGLDAKYNDGLFVSDGTAAGSYELTFTGSEPQGFFADGGKVFFEATDRAGKAGLWVADGTKGGTHEIAINGAYSQGVFSDISFSGLNSGTIGAYEKNFAIVGSNVVFYGEDALGRNSLWITNGTTAGTKEIYAGLTVSDLTSVAAGAKAAIASGDVELGDDLKAGVSLFSQYTAAGFQSGHAAVTATAVAEASLSDSLHGALSVNRA